MSVNIPWSDIDAGCHEIASWVKTLDVSFRGIWGPSRGGLIPGVILSHKLNLKLFEDPRVRPLLIVDDIADTGKTLHSLSKLNDVYVATLFYHKQSSFIPDKWVFEKKDEWLVYPWEQK
jgi:hypoxanthine phosphoribosyltransferase